MPQQFVEGYLSGLGRALEFCKGWLGIRKGCRGLLIITEGGRERLVGSRAFEAGRITRGPRRLYPCLRKQRMSHSPQIFSVLIPLSLGPLPPPPPFPPSHCTDTDSPSSCQLPQSLTQILMRQRPSRSHPPVSLPFCTFPLQPRIHCFRICHHMQLHPWCLIFHCRLYSARGGLGCAERPK